MKKQYKLFIVLLLLFFLTACECSHTWEEASCIVPKTCTQCDATEGTAPGHQWIEASCSTPKTCINCGETDGEPLPHTHLEWSGFGDNVIIQKCEDCGAEESTPAENISILMDLLKGTWKCNGYEQRSKSWEISLQEEYLIQIEEDPNNFTFVFDDNSYSACIQNVSYYSSEHFQGYNFLLFAGDVIHPFEYRMVTSTSVNNPATEYLQVSSQLAGLNDYLVYTYHNTEIDTSVVGSWDFSESMSTDANLRAQRNTTWTDIITCYEDGTAVLETAHGTYETQWRFRDLRLDLLDESTVVEYELMDNDGNWFHRLMLKAGDSLQPYFVYDDDFPIFKRQNIDTTE